MSTASTERLRWGWILPLAIVFLLVLAYLVAHTGSTLPSYQGKSIYQWAGQLQQAQQNYSDSERWKKIQSASEAIRAIGTNALPFVMADVQARFTSKDRFIAWLAPRVRFLKLQPGKIEDRWVRGIRALEALGPLAKPCLPELIALASKSTGYAEGALVAVGPDAIPAFTNLLAASKFPRTGNLIGAFANAVFAERITSEQAAVALPFLVQVFRSTDSHGRWYAASAIGAIHQQPDICVPLLLEGLTDPTPSVRQSCIESLGRFGEAASTHADKFAEAFDQADAHSRRAICGALGSFHSAAAIAVPVLIRGLQDPDESVRIWAATALGQLASLPEQSVPALAKAVEDRSAIVRLMAVQSLGQEGAPATNALSAIQHACLDADASVRNAATNALMRLRL